RRRCRARHDPRRAARAPRRRRRGLRGGGHRVPLRPAPDRPHGGRRPRSRRAVTTATSTRHAPAARAETRADRLWAALPILCVFALFAFVYAWEAWLVASPYVFVDELRYSQIARSIAESGTLS